MGHACLLMASTLLVWLSAALVQAATPDLLVGAPPLRDFWWAPLITGFALWLLAEKGVLPRLCLWLASAGWVGVVACALLYAGAGIYARGHAAHGPELRSQIVKFERRGGRRIKTTITTLALQDGSFATTGTYAPSGRGDVGRCLAVRKLTGPFGFVWLRIEQAAPLPPAPGPGQLDWPVDQPSRAECFSGKALSDLAARS